MKYGLKDKQLEEIEGIFRACPEVSTAWLFGSRAKGTYKHASDIDLALKGALGRKTLMRIKDAFDDSNLPFFVDVLDYEALNDGALKMQIDTHGVLIYEREKDEHH